MQVDLITAVVLLVGVTAAALLAILVGKLSARVFFHASTVGSTRTRRRTSHRR
jgi:hypothetical protein